MIIKRLENDWILYYGPTIILLCVAIVAAFCWVAAYFELGGADGNQVAVGKEYVFSEQCGSSTITYTAASRRPAAVVCQGEEL